MRILRKNRNCAGMTITELVVSMGIGSILMVVLLMLSVYTARSFGAISNYCALDKDSRKALDQLTTMIREADGVTDYSTNELHLSYHGFDLRYLYSPSAKTLTQTTNNVTKTILTGCDTFAFNIYQRNAVGGSYDQYPATLDDSAAKIVQVSWICSRTLVRNLINTESIQSAKIVIRKQ